jgi:hypothetical protein
MSRRRTDYGTVLLHAVLAIALGVAFLTGLRIATEAPDRRWINLFDALLPYENVWTTHMAAAVVIVAGSIGYAVYIARSGLKRRIALDTIRARGLFGRGAVRLGAFNILLYWVFFVALSSLIVTGGMLYFGVAAGSGTNRLHWIATWTLPAFVVCHVLAHFRIGGWAQLFRIVRPTALAAPPPELDAGELLTLLVKQSSELAPHDMPPHAGIENDRDHPHQQIARPRPARRASVVQSNPLVVAAAVAMTGAGLIIAIDREATDTLEVHRINSGDAPVLDGETSDPVWRNIKPFTVTTNQGGNFDGTGETRVEIRAVHDGTWAYFLFVWEDPTRSLKQLPLKKTAEGWTLLHDGYERGDEHKYNEDKFSVLLTTLDVTLAGDRTFHASPRPLPDAPPTRTGRGLHYTMDSNTYADVWQWKATSTGATGWMDDDHFGPPAEVADAEAQGKAAYRGGFAPDPGTAGYADNFDARGGDDFKHVTPRRLPRDLAATLKAMGPLDLDPDHSDGEQTRWFMTEAESVPYSPYADTRIPVGTVIPGVILSGEFSGDRADIRCAARWASGRWALEVARKLDTHSRYDVAIRSGVFMRVAAFDHSQIQHTRHVRPIRLEVE